jgi:hypothetical protein
MYEREIEHDGYIFPDECSLNEYLCDEPVGWGSNPSNFGAVKVEDKYSKSNPSNFDVVKSLEDKYGNLNPSNYSDKSNEEEQPVEYSNKNCTYIRETGKAYLVQDEGGQFWIPKSILKSIEINSDKISFEYPLWFEKKYISENIDNIEETPTTERIKDIQSRLAYVIGKLDKSIELAEQNKIIVAKLREIKKML